MGGTVVADLPHPHRGYTKKEMIGRTPFDFDDDENRRIFEEQISRIPDTMHRSYGITLRKKSGEDVNTWFNATTLKDESGALMGSLAMVTDITERKRADDFSEIRCLEISGLTVVAE